MRAEDLDLMLELVGEPRVVGVEQSHILAPGVLEPQVAGGAHAAILMPRVLQVADALRLPFGVATGDVSAAVVGAVIHQQELPVRVRLSDHAPDGLIQKALTVQEDRDDRHQWRVHPSPVA